MDQMTAAPEILCLSMSSCFLFTSASPCSQVTPSYVVTMLYAPLLIRTKITSLETNFFPLPCFLKILLTLNGNSAAGHPACGFTELMETPFTSLLCQNQPNKHPATRVRVPKRGPSPPNLHPLPLFLSLSASRSNQSMQGWAAPFVSFCSSNWPPSGKLMTRALLEWLQRGTSRAA